MHCPFCGEADTKVIDSRLAGDGDQVRRRRKCVVCRERFTTFETAELNLPRVIKQDGTRVPFDGTKLAAGMMRSPVVPMAGGAGQPVTFSLLLGKYLLAFELISVVLVAAIIGALGIGKGERKLPWK